MMHSTDNIIYTKFSELAAQLQILIPAASWSRDTGLHINMEKHRVQKLAKIY